jgi:hypothetical protein
MPIYADRRRFLLAGLLISLTGCGTFMYPERQGQPRGGPIDWKVVALDGIGLLLFVVPGVIAFAVDWYNGTLFLPVESAEYSTTAVKTPQRGRLLSVLLGRDRLNRETLEAELLARAGVRVKLEPGAYSTAELAHIDEFDAKVAEIAAA